MKSQRSCITKHNFATVRRRKSGEHALRQRREQRGGTQLRFFRATSQEQKIKNERILVHTKNCLPSRLWFSPNITYKITIEDLIGTLFKNWLTTKSRPIARMEITRNNGKCDYTTREVNDKHWTKIWSWGKNIGRWHFIYNTAFVFNLPNMQCFR